MRFERIKDSNTSEFQKCFEIYQNSFPPFERRTQEDQIWALENNDYHFEVIKNEVGEILGILFTWQTDAFLYVEHFAILESARGQNIGTQVLNHLIEKTKVPLILEIDPPIDEISLRRKGFYERLGFEQNEFLHIHPSYRKDTKPHELKILSLPKITQAVYTAFFGYLMNTVMYYSEHVKSDVLNIMPKEDA